MTLLIIAFVAGALTVLAPCILPLLPIVVGGSVTDQRRPLRPYVITASLAISVVLFTFLLKFSTSLLSVPTMVWQVLSGLIIIALGVSMLWPSLWERLGARLNISTSRLLGSAGKQKGLVGDILTGAALGPVFSSCSPTYAFIVAGVLPVSFGQGLGYLLAYALGLAAVLLVVALLGQKIIARLGWATDPKGWFKRVMGVIFILVGISVSTGFDHSIQAYFVKQGWYDIPAQFESSLLNR